MFTSRLCKFRTSLVRPRVYTTFSRKFADEIIVKDLRGTDSTKPTTVNIDLNQEGRDLFIDTSGLKKRPSN